MNTAQHVSEVRTQIYLPFHMHKKLQETADKKNMSMARFIRETLAKELDIKKEKEKREKDWKEFMKLAGFIKGEPSDVSQKSGEYFAQAVWENMQKNRRKK